MREGRRPYACAVRNRAPVAYQIVAVVAFGGLDGSQCFAYRHHRSPAHAQEVRDQRFDVVHRAVLHWGSSQRVIRFIGTLRHMVHALLDNQQALAHLLDMHRRPVIAIAVFARWNVKLILFVSGVGLAFAKIPFESTSAERGTGHAPLNSFIHSEATDTLGARFENPVSHHGAVVLDKAGRQVLYKILDHVVHPLGKSAATPPIRNQAGCMRAPVIASMIPKARSRSLNVKKTGDICPRSCANVPYQTRWLIMRNSSASMTRIT